MNIFIDTNILLDVLRAREPFLKNSLAIWALVEREKITGYISAISFNNTYYILRSAVGNNKAYEAMRIIRDTFRIVALDERIMNKAIDADFKDFEDAIQFFSAIHADADYIVTRNVKDFFQNDIPVLTPEAFLALDP
ncbi:MAG: PIN domain-containing protein [Kiritimatiellaeota bacterium]|nr:PIN domain-containing protein [Kiritimatiellota bacterium]